MKFLFVLIQPLCLAWLLLGLWIVFACWRRSWRNAALPASAWLILTLLTCTPLASLLMSELEGGQAPIQIRDLPAADVIVCLGGGAEPSRSEPTGVHLKTSGDRLTTALALLAQKKAPLLLLGGGGYQDKGETMPEADQVIKFIRTLAGNADSITSLGICADTHDEAVKVAALFKERGWKRVLLVTSAYHMPRAAGTFRKAGIAFDTVPCNYLSSINRIGDFHWLHLPHPEAFAVFATWFHEMLGTWLYRSKGWI
jgi:uncharacterized SAM-binding protein YcdF (DUF218 family)